MSENYIVSARKYRPQTFDTVVGQAHITTTLQNAIRNQHLAHAYLFCGPRGVGKTTCARILARTINCEQPTSETEACGVCNTCLSFTNNTSFNVFELDAASNNSVDDIRNLIDQVRFAPQQGKYKIYIIDEVHMLSASAFNAFLKTLEEPPPYAIFILATTEKHKILPTILSRCQIFDFKRITTNDISGHLDGIVRKESLKADEAALHVIAQKSEGCMRDALSMLDRISSFTNGVLTYANTMEHLNLLDADYYFRLSDHMLSQDVGGTLLLLDQALEKGFEGDVIISGMAEHMRNLLLCKDQRMAKLLEVPNDHKPIYFEKANQTPPAFILSGLNVINDAELGYKNATNKRLHIELCLIRLCYVLQATKIDGDSEKKKTGNINIAIPVSSGTAHVSSSVPAPVSSLPASSMTGSVQASRGVSVPADMPAGQSRDERESQSRYEGGNLPRDEQGNSMPVQQSVPVQKPVSAATPALSVQPPSLQVQGLTDATSSEAAPGNVTRRISRNLIDHIDAEMDRRKAVSENLAPAELTEELVQSMFNQYKKEIQAQNKSVFYAQLSMMVPEVMPPDEMRIVSPTEMTNEYALNNRNEMIDYFSRAAGIRVRVTTEVRINKDLVTDQKKILSKSEIYEEMAAKNPYLAALKDELNLQIDY